MRVVDNKVAVVTGGAGGIGGAIARRFAREGAHLSLVDIDADAAKTIATELTAKKTDVITVVADVTNKQSVQGWFKRRSTAGAGSIFLSTSPAAPIGSSSST